MLCRVGGRSIADEPQARERLALLAERQAHWFAPYAIGERRPLNRLVNLLTLPDRSVASYVESETQGHLDRETTCAVPLLSAYYQLRAEALSQAASVDMANDVRKGSR